MKDIEHFTTDNNGEFLTIPTMDKLCKMLKRKFEEKEEDNNYLREQIKELKDEKWKDKELQKMKKELQETKADAARGFPISKAEYDAAIDWMNKHELAKHYNSTKLFPRGGAIGGSYTWSFVPTSIGVFGTIHCSCGEEFVFQEEA